jgi:hypothetical protein
MESNEIADAWSAPFRAADCDNGQSKIRAPVLITPAVLDQSGM